MFLATREMLFSKTRYILIVVVIFLSVYLTLFLTGLAYGLANDNKSAVEAWQADGIVLNKNANNSLSMSFINQTQYQSIKGNKTSKLSASPTIINQSNSTKGINSYIFAIDTKEYINPKISEGKMFENAFEVVVDDSIKIKYNYNIGDKLSFTNVKQEFTIVGFANNHKFNTAPVIYMTLTDFHKLMNMPSTSVENNSINAVIFKGDNISYDKNSLTTLSINQFINEIPGYQPQVLTFGLMIGFLIGIVALVLGIFIYVLTIQKINMFGVMKAQGISNKTIVWSVVSQVLVLSTIGIFIGLIFTLLTAFFLPNTVPFRMNYSFIGIIILLFYFFALIGGLFSVKSAVKVDPLIAMGG